MKELITVASGFIIVVALALFMFIGNQKHTISVMQNKELNDVVEKNQLELKTEIETLKLHIREIDSIYHKKTSE
jgi:hypothetical protein